MSKKKKILFLSQYFYPEYVSSATLPFDTAKRLVEEGYSVDALCGYPKEYYEKSQVPLKERKNGIDIKRLNYLQMKRTSKVGRLVNFMSFTFKVFLHLKEFSKYAVVIVYSDPPVLPLVSAIAKKLFKCKMIFVAYDLYPEIAIRTGTIGEKSMISNMMKSVNSMVFKNADGVVALSSEMKKFLIENRNINEEKIFIIPNWYSDKGERKRIDSNNKFYGQFKDKFVVSYFGNMGTAEDVDTIIGTIDILKDNSDIQFMFAGHGNKMEHLKSVISKNKYKNAVVYDFLHGKDFEDALEITGCAIISLNEGLTGLCVPSKSYSYMSKGIPLLVIMGESDLVNDIRSGAGYQIHNSDCVHMADVILKMSKDEEAVSNMKKKCRKLFMEKYETSVCTKQYVEMIQKIINN